VRAKVRPRSFSLSTRAATNASGSHLTRLEKALGQLASKLGRRPYTTPTAVQKRVATLLKGHPARPFLRVQVSGGPGTAWPLTLSWTRNNRMLAPPLRTLMVATRASIAGHGQDPVKDGLT
jgi:hypothetical protein